MSASVKKLKIANKMVKSDVFHATQGDLDLYVGSHRNEVTIYLQTYSEVKFEFNGTLQELAERLAK